MTTFLILHLCNCVYLSLFLYLSHVNGAEWNKSSCLVLFCPLHNGQLGDRRVACAASISARVRRESWDKNKKKGMMGMTFFFRSRSNFRAITRLETLATQANRSGEVTGIVEVRLYLFIYLFTVFIYLFIYLFIHSFINLWRIVHSTGVYFPYKEVWRWTIRYLDHHFFLFFFYYFKVSMLVLKKKFVIKGEKKDVWESVVHFSNGHHPFLFQSRLQLACFVCHPTSRALLQ